MWHVALKFSDETVDFDETFETREDAYAYGVEMIGNYFTGSAELTMRDPDENPYEEWANERPKIKVWKD